MKNLSSLSLLFFLTGCLTQNPIIELAPTDPTSLTVSPVSPSNDTTPTISGQTSSAVAVVLYSAPGCSGSVLATGHASNSGQFSLTSGDLTTGMYNFSVRASNARGTICSSSTVAYNLTATPPLVSVTKDENSPALINSTGTVNFFVEYTEADEVNLTADDIFISDSGTVACTGITVTDGTTATPHVAISNCTGDGTFGISVAAGTATNLAGSSLGSNMSSTVTVDNAGISTATFDLPAGTYTEMPSSIVVTFPEAYNNLETGDFSFGGTCSIKPNITQLDRTSLSGTLTLTAPTCTPGQTVEITLDLEGITDSAGNPGVGQLVTTYTIDAVGPTSATFNPGAGSIKEIPTSIDVTFSEAINPDSLFDTSFAVTGDCAPDPTVSRGTVSGASVPITLAGGTCVHGDELTITINLTTVEDTMGSPGSGSASVTYTYDTIGPVVTTIDQVTSTVAAPPASVTFTFDEAVLIDSITEADLQFSGSCSAGVSSELTTLVSGTSMSFNLLGVSCSDGQELTLTLNGSGVTDAAGNPGTGTITATYTVDGTGPAVASVSPDSGKVNGITASLVFTFTEDLKISSVGTDDFSLAGTCDYLPTSWTVGGVVGNAVTINLNNVSCDEGEFVTITAATTGIEDIYGNIGSTSHPVTYTQDGTGPVAQSFTLDTTGTPFVGTLTFDEDVQGPVVLSDFNVSSAFCPTVALDDIAVNGAIVTFNLTLTCDPAGTVTISLKDGSIEDMAGNQSISTSLDVNYTEP